MPGPEEGALPPPGVANGIFSSMVSEAVVTEIEVLARPAHRPVWGQAIWDGATGLRDTQTGESAADCAGCCWGSG